MNQDIGGCCDGDPHFLVFETGCVGGVRPHPEPLERVQPESFACIKRPFILNPTVRPRYRSAIIRLLHNTLCPDSESESPSQVYTVESIIRIKPTPCSALVFIKKENEYRVQVFLCEVINSPKDRTRTMPRAEDTRGLLFAPGRFTVPFNAVTPGRLSLAKNFPLIKLCGNRSVK